MVYYISKLDICFSLPRPYGSPERGHPLATLGCLMATAEKPEMGELVSGATTEAQEIALQLISEANPNCNNRSTYFRKSLVIMVQMEGVESKFRGCVAVRKCAL